MEPGIVPIEIDPIEYQAWRQSPEPIPHLLLDIREPWEHETARIEGDRLIPMNDVPLHLDELPRDGDVIVYCHHGVRSYQVAYYLRQHGYTRVRSLRGGIARWSSDIDPNVPTY